MDTALCTFVGFGVNIRILFLELEVRLFSVNKSGCMVITSRKMEKLENAPAEDWRNC